ncbi:head GIN domain-containing protein [Puia dinghuensis]|uniref:Putative auto-transporter adhesin head GIN domain-containing protein n=1 Tax=Puia dinghuensis TaxID=1792502 RepID=A0A8J2XWS4_9BACT|nr:head GIN domain-containing protein [Puia dinghuensis]GGB21963.1 hypothetical protein GCM10011511_52270 [Puia dinghuensis]
MCRSLFLLLAGSFLLLTVHAQKTIINDPNAEVRPVKGYHGIEVSGGINLYLSQGEEEAVVVSASNLKWREHIRTEVVDGILKISLDQHRWSRGNIKIKAYVSFTTLDRLTASGASNVFVDGVITGDRLAIDLSGASDFKGAINVKELRLEQSGASDSHVTGVVAELAEIHSSGASDVKGYDLTIQNCSVHASGASDIRVTVNKELSADLSGASSVFYKGDAVIKDVRSSGASTVKKSS